MIMLVLSSHPPLPHHLSLAIFAPPLVYAKCYVNYVSLWGAFVIIVYCFLYLLPRNLVEPYQ